MVIPQPPRISAIVAMAENRVIGKENQLPWRLSADLKHFKDLTTGHTVIMGRKTYQSIGKALPHRTNIIISRDSDFRANGCLVTISPEAAIDLAQQTPHQEIFIIGGAHIYEAFMPRLDQIYLTIVHRNFDGDTFFPVLNLDEWVEIEREKHDSHEGYAYSFVTLKRK